MTERRRCSRCHVTLAYSDDGHDWRILLPSVHYLTKWYCSECWKILHDIARRTGGTL